jgi:hypothetical protein
LHDEPYKPNSRVIWESYETIGVKCFAYFPCKNERIWQNVKRRETGECVNDFKLLLFDSIFDYANYIEENFARADREHTRDMLLANRDVYFSARKRNFKCNHLFPNFSLDIAQSFEKRYFPTEKEATTAGPEEKEEVAATTTTTTTLDLLALTKNTQINYSTSNEETVLERKKRNLNAPTLILLLIGVAFSGVFSIYQFFRLIG